MQPTETSVEKSNFYLAETYQELKFGTQHKRNNYIVTKKKSRISAYLEYAAMNNTNVSKIFSV